MKSNTLIQPIDAKMATKVWIDTTRFA